MLVPICRAICLILIVGVLGGCAMTERGQPLPDMAPTVNETLSKTRFGLAASDLLAITFPNTPQWNHEVRVDLNGKASFLGIPEEIQVSGLTAENLRTTLEEKYQEFLTKPRLGVSVKEFSVRPISVVGDVGSAGMVQIQSTSIALLGAIAQAGGHLKETADLKRVVLVRWDGQGNRQLRWTIDASLKYWGIGDPVRLQPNDLVFVPNSAVDEVNIWVNNWIRRMLPVSTVPGI